MKKVLENQLVIKISLLWIVSLTLISAAATADFSKSVSPPDSSKVLPGLSHKSARHPEPASDSVCEVVSDDKCFDESAREHLRELMYSLETKDIDVVNQTRDLLNEIGKPAIDFFIDGIQYYPKEVRYEAIKILFSIDMQWSRRAGKIFQKDPYPEVRFEFARNLFRLEPDMRRSFIWDLWRDPVADVSAACVTCFGKTGGYYEARHILISLDREDALCTTRLYPEVHNLATACHRAFSTIMQDEPDYFISQVIKTPHDLEAIKFFWSIRLDQVQRLKDIYAAGESAVSWPHWSYPQLVRLRYLLLKAYESKIDGRMVRQKYAEFLELHPDFGRSPEIACRLGELHNSVILLGTERDEEKAKHYYELTLSLCDNINKKHPGVYYEALKAHLGLAYLIDDFSSKKMHWQSIYHSDPNKVAILPDTEFPLSKDEYQHHLEWLRERVESIREKAAEGLVNIYDLPDLHEGLKGLTELMEEYKHDELILELAQKKYQKLSQRQQ